MAIPARLEVCLRNDAGLVCNPTGPDIRINAQSPLTLSPVRKAICNLIQRAFGNEDNFAFRVTWDSIQQESSTNPDARAARRYSILAMSGIDVVEMDEYEEAMPEWERQFTDFAKLWGIDVHTQKSQVDPELTIIESYRKRICPYPHKSQDYILGENTLGYAFFEGQSSVVFPSYVTVDDDQKAHIDHSRDQTKVHEDFHFLAASIFGKNKYIVEMGLLSEGITPVLELFYSSLNAKPPLTTDQIFEALNKAQNPLEQNDTWRDLTQIYGWATAHNNNFVIENTNSTHISMPILKLVRDSGITFQDFVSTYLKSNSTDDLVQKLGEKTTFTESLAEFSRFLRNELLVIGIRRSGKRLQY